MTNFIFIFVVNNKWFSLFQLNRKKTDGFQDKFENISLAYRNRKGTTNGTNYNFFRKEYVSDQILDSYFTILKRFRFQKELHNYTVFKLVYIICSDVARVHSNPAELHLQHSQVQNEQLNQ